MEILKECCRKVVTRCLINLQVVRTDFLQGGKDFVTWSHLSVPKQMQKRSVCHAGGGGCMPLKIGSHRIWVKHLKGSIMLGL